MEAKINISVQTVTSPAPSQWIRITAGTKSLPIRRGVTTLAHNESERAPEGRDLLVRSGELAEHSRWIITKVCVVTKMVTVYSTGQFFQ